MRALAPWDGRGAGRPPHGSVAAVALGQPYHLALELAIGDGDGDAVAGGDGGDGGDGAVVGGAADEGVTAGEGRERAKRIELEVALADLAVATVQRLAHGEAGALSRAQHARLSAGDVRRGPDEAIDGAVEIPARVLDATAERLAERLGM